MKKYTTAVLGIGVRGMTHLKGLIETGRFEIVGLCDLELEKAKQGAEFYKLDVPCYTDAEQMLAETKPDVFVFVTHPNVRLPMVKLAQKYGVKGISLEKPMAESLQEAREMAKICKESGIKAIVCHQQKYLSQMQEMKKRIEDGDIGDIVKIHVECQPWMAQLGTHFVDYALWVNGGHRAKWVIGHVSGRATLADSHPSPDFIMGEILMENGTRAYIECGDLAEAHREPGYEDFDNRMTVYGTKGYVWCETDGWWGAFTAKTKGELVTGKNPGWYHHQEKAIQTPYYREYAAWLDDDAQVHSCNIDTACHGYEILEGMCLSALDNTRVYLPITNVDYEPVLDRMERELPDVGTKLRVLYDGKLPRKEYD